MSKKSKNFIIIVVILVAVVIVALALKSRNTPQTTSPLSSSNTNVLPGLGTPGASAPAANNDEFSTLLSSIKSITIDTSLFDNPGYKMLRDFPVSLGSDVVGRTNPFAPIGSDAGGAPAKDVSVETLQSGKVTSTTAEFGAQVTSADTVPTSIVFEYGTNDTFGSVTPAIVMTKSGTALSTVTKLLPETLYYVRAVAVRGALTVIGNTTSFTTTKK